MGCPAGVPDADGGGNVLSSVDFVAQVGKSALGFFYFDVAVFYTGDTCRVVTAIFKLCKSVQQYGSDLALSYISNYSAHKFNLFSKVKIT